ncbi:MAG: carboxypeptidase-like regulatory domain-containing protein [Candidatus Sericytochromatia bacterium]|nr:carboxypeptidase-like regulatory domain-containing protein [Candidatus Sericytochromatia bacterium]
MVVSGPPPSGKTVVVSGTVRSEKGATVDGATVTVKSLDASVPYTASVTTTGGAYIINNVPEGANVEVVVTKDGWTSRRRVASFQQSATGSQNIFNFGGTDPSDPGAAYFISDYPEITSTTPAHDAKGVDANKLTFTVRLSEALDEDSRDALDKAFTIVPTSYESALDVSGTSKPFFDVVTAERAGEVLAGITAVRYPYAIRANSQLFGTAANRLRPRWNSSGTEVTYTFDHSLQASSGANAEYQAVLFAMTDWRIEDLKGNQLGTDAAGNLTWPAAGTLLCNVFKDNDLFYDGAVRNAWAQTHTSSLRFEVKRDEFSPKLTDVQVTPDGPDIRIDLAFSESLGAWVGDDMVRVDATVKDLSNYSFKVGALPGDLTDEGLDGSGIVLSGPSIAAMKASLQPKIEFQFPQRSIADVTLDATTPSILHLWIRGGAQENLFGGYRVIKARVAGIKDPAGNAIGWTDADRNLRSSSL